MPFLPFFNLANDPSDRVDCRYRQWAPIYKSRAPGEHEQREGRVVHLYVAGIRPKLETLPRVHDQTAVQGQFTRVPTIGIRDQRLTGLAYVAARHERLPVSSQILPVFGRTYRCRVSCDPSQRWLTFPS
jgi:hypothetical protein